MNLDHWLGIASEAANVLQAIVWLLFAVGVFAYFRRPVREFLRQAAELTIKAGPSGIEATMRRQVIEVSATLAAAEATKVPATGSGSELSPDQVGEIVRVVEGTISPSVGKPFADASILWVDDRPSNNTYERRSFESLGIHVALALSTEDALAKLEEGRSYDVIISDMGRPPDPEAGYTLLRALRKMRIQTPFVIYAGSNSPEHKARARSEGAQGSTNNPAELFELVIDAIKGGPGRVAR